MSDTVTFTIDGRTCTASRGQTVVQAARDNGIYIPVLCDYEGLPAAATCRICTVKIQGRPTTACTTKIAAGMEIENDTPELNNMRKAIVEMLFVEGNHFCPSCEKSGQCELQALAYRFQMMVPRYTYTFPQRSVDAQDSRILIEPNRCVLCKRCVRSVTARNGQHVFAFVNRGNRTDIAMDKELSQTLSGKEADDAMNLCPVGAIIRKERGFAVPIGKRKYDHAPIGSDIETKKASS